MNKPRHYSLHFRTNDYQLELWVLPANRDTYASVATALKTIPELDDITAAGGIFRARYLVLTRGTEGNWDKICAHIHQLMQDNFRAQENWSAILT